PEASVDIPEKLINIEGLFESKNPRLLKIIPRWVISYLKKIIHQDAVNGYIYRNRDKSGLPFVEAILQEFGVTVHSEFSAGPSLPTDLKDLLQNRRVIVAANHPLGGLDGLAR
ncbi:MAG: hypothetical protein WCJ49_08770, partial [Deltaproteobacteria bacterium]